MAKGYLRFKFRSKRWWNCRINSLCERFPFQRVTIGFEFATEILCIGFKTTIMPLWLFLRMTLNAIDGMLAREHDMQSKLGAVLRPFILAAFLYFIFLYQVRLIRCWSI